MKSFRSFRPFVLAALLLPAWQMLGGEFFFVRMLFGTPLSIIEFVHVQWPRLIKDFLYTAGTSSVGAACAVTTGCLLGFLSLKYSQIRIAATSIARSAQLIPILAFAPLVTVVLGSGFAAQIAIAFLVGIFPALTILLASLDRLPQSHREMIRLYRLPFLVSVRLIVAPFALPALLSGAKITAVACVVGASVAEFLGSRHGLGRNIFEAAVRIESELMMTSVFGIVLLGATLSSIIDKVTKKYVRWEAL